MALQDLLGRIGPEVEDPEEETFLLFSRDIPSSQDLGFVDARAAALGLSVAGREYTIHQSPTLLTSNREGGTTGAVWKITPLVASYLASRDGALRASGVLGPSARVLELGCGVSGLVGLAVAPAVARYVLTDQPYVARLVERNISENLLAAAPAPRTRRAARGKIPPAPAPNLTFAPLDWELDEVTPRLLAADDRGGERDAPGASDGGGGGFDVVIACDCIYNEALIKPLVQTCADVCGLRKKKTPLAAGAGAEKTDHPTVCVVAQQLRDPDVLEAWLREFLRRFRAWRVPDHALSAPLRSNPGFVIHVGVLRDAM